MKKLHFTSLHDDLTQIFNRRGVLHESKAMIDSIQSSKQTLGVIYFDLDGLKYINDNFGHNVGDHYIRSFARALKKNIRNVDICGRLGGDEFIAFCRNISPEAVSHIIQRIRTDFIRCCSELEINGYPDFSQGTLFYSNDIPYVEDLINEADHKMYKNKVSKRCL